MSCKTQKMRSMLHFIIYRMRLTIALAIVLMACAPPTIQPPTQTAQSTKGIGSSAAEINAALASIAAQTALPSSDYQIGPEDLLQITLHNIPEATSYQLQSSPVTSYRAPRTVTLRVSQQGMITLPLIGEIKVLGLTSAGLERELRNRYEKYLYNPDVGVLVTEYRQRVSVMGSVQKPGVFELSGPKTVIDILAMAGGVTEKAGTQVHIYRQGAKGRESHVIDLLVLASNATLINADNAGLITMPVQAGDVINVPPAGTFFVDGAVKAPGPYPLGRRYSLTMALATAGGVDRELYSSDISIFRRKGSGRENISLDLDAILSGSAADPQIEADDVIVVPISGARYFVKRFVGQLFSIGGVGPGIAGS
jgi:polysaccharide export outer membrane protein